MDAINHQDFFDRYADLNDKYVDCKDGIPFGESDEKQLEAIKEELDKYECYFSKIRKAKCLIEKVNNGENNPSYIVNSYNLLFKSRDRLKAKIEKGEKVDEFNRLYYKFLSENLK